ncbi:hypothetical protein ACKAV7_013217 [Fusarium commune]
MDPSMSLNHEEALAHMTTQSEPIIRSRHSLVGGFHTSHSGADGATDGFTDAEARGPVGYHEPDKVSLRRMKTEGSVTEFAPSQMQASELTGLQFDKQIRDINKKLPTPGRISDALRGEPNLRVRIMSATVQSAHPEYRSKRFLPRNEIPKLLTREAVEKELAQCDRWLRYPIIRLLRPRMPNFQEEAQIICGIADRDLGANTVCKTYQKIFTILVLLKRSSLIISFLEKNVCDDDLPLKLGDKTNTDVFTVITDNGKKVTLHGFRQKKSFYDKFIEKQWILAFAIKRIKPSTSLHKARINPEDEATVLRKLKDRHPYLISLLATYHHHDGYHFIFPWAEADLQGYWKMINPKPFGADRDRTLKWLGIQCKGLADGLSSIHCYPTTSFSLHGRFTPPPDNPRIVGNVAENAIHELFGRHGDMKPENILWFPERPSIPGTLGGILKITDFGFTEFSTKSEVDPARRGFIVNSPTYRAPEIDISSDNGLIGPSYDIWALGCIYLEFLAWWLGGWDYVHSFAKRRLGHDVIFWGGRKEGHRTDAFFSIIQFEETGRYRAEVRKSVNEVSHSNVGVMNLSVYPIV